MFEKASRMKLRYETSQGRITVEDLWDLPLTSTIANKPHLDGIARGLHTQLKNTEDVSFVTKNKNVDESLQLKFDIVKHIIDIKLKENEKKDELRANKEKKQKIQALIERKKEDQLAETSLEDLQKMADALP